MEHICFELANVEVTYLDKEVFRIDRLAVHQFDRIGIVGKNGAGKSTLLKLLAGIVQPMSGNVKRHVEFGLFEQMEAPADAEADPALLGRLAVPNCTEGLSGGEQTRLKLAHLLTHYYEALLIDEPTTHLDQEGIAFLLDELRYYCGALVLISHDRVVLDELVTTIWEVHEGKVRVYAGNYSGYIEQKRLEREQQMQAHEQFIKEKNRLEKAAQEKMKKAEKIAQAGSMSRKESKTLANRMFETKSKGTSQKAVHRAARAIEHRMEKLQKVEAVQEDRQIVFRQAKALELHNKYPIMADRLTLQIGDTILLKDVNFQFPLGKKIAITGANGSGKSSLLEHIANAGAGLTISPKAKMGWFRQMSYQFTSNETVLQFVKNGSDYEEGFLRGVLHAMQFIGTDIQKSVRSLSGGESIRLQLCLLFLGEYNILLLDEPTNFLDIYAVEALERFISGYEGTIIFVTHDKKFVEHAAEVHFHLSDHKLHLM
ncbi:ABC-F type ribosomal protection protein [Paenibacillus alvei]|uniref:ABC-F type ribosomal protection protein n=1 Tax=Paenibacillus alvei TaxID=44250 RepID=A0ABT4GW09_PAEAL|nr:ABC-F type ribosomal protection protein [Paenibacillus alvei]EJW15244.1 ABC transporter-like protein [Paenibacillus alvei DSM 29]MCY9544192.1 ABC-F type ribosomal protection protein [Paenibacillus alvei]MCY9702897.1 ABC-F type ribosomal protection protein [Paenibacillus alvei]MCY9733212.1 ABC-F type ribosomal protection protein [Paenibacillus alvei]MCY9754077.1 ABC-F type ribosomal protection protein [Paenibacillus alvei]